MIDPIEFETKRLRLRQWLPEDKEAFARLNADPRVMEFFLKLLDHAESNAMADRIESLISERGWGFWAVEVKGGEKFIGFTGLHIPIAELPFSPCVEVGWRLAFDHWGNGYATEAAKGALSVGFETLNLGEIVSFASIGNFRSRSVMEKLGMIRDGKSFEHPGMPAGNPLREHCLYRLSHQQWLTQYSQNRKRDEKS
jgi:RimJ/RimL family protein N-acetyltransferase